MVFKKQRKGKNYKNIMTNIIKHKKIKNKFIISEQTDWKNKLQEMKKRKDNLINSLKGK